MFYIISYIMGYLFYMESPKSLALGGGIISLGGTSDFAEVPDSRRIRREVFRPSDSMPPYNILLE